MICSSNFTDSEAKITLSDPQKTILKRDGEVRLYASYIVKKDDLLHEYFHDKSRAFVQVNERNWVFSDEVKTFLKVGGADLSGTVAQTFAAGTITAVVTIINAAYSDVAAEQVTLTLPRPVGATAGFVAVGTLPAGVTIAANGSVNVLLPSLAIGAGIQFSVTYTVPAAVVGSPKVYVVGGIVSSKIHDPNMENNLISSVVADA